jgi:exodeoxyribonuclease VII large subunit
MQLSLFNAEPTVYTVAEISAYLRRKLDADATLQNLWLEGEISNWKQAASGHIYFTLKDKSASIRCVIWRTQAQRLVYTPQRDGEQVLAHGKISVYEAGGNYQFYVDNLEPVGQGALYAEFERIKNRLAAEGLFDPDRKQPLPPFPRTIGVVTSSTGAALRDILNVLRRRFPLGQVLLSPTPVQGDAAPPQIIAALENVSRQEVDVIIMARGGGSLEDLWAFNDESLARAVADCPVPVVAGVGHEIDFTIVDFVADVRAPTPSAAAELAVPDQAELTRAVTALRLALFDTAQQQIAETRRQLQTRQWAISRLSPQNKIDNYRQQIDSLTGEAGRSVQYGLALQRERVNTLAAKLTALNPHTVLARGYAIVHKEGQIVSRIGQVQPGDTLSVQVSDGEFNVDVKDWSNQNE